MRASATAEPQSVVEEKLPASGHWWVTPCAALEPDRRDSRLFPLNGRYPKRQSANDRFGVSKPNARLRSGHDNHHEDGPSCKRPPVPPNGSPADVRYLALISMVAMTAKGTLKPLANVRFRANTSLMNRFGLHSGEAHGIRQSSGYGSPWPAPS